MILTMPYYRSEARLRQFAIATTEEQPAKKFAQIPFIEVWLFKFRLWARSSRPLIANTCGAKKSVIPVSIADAQDSSRGI
jgi:hypothetical protein